MSEDELRESNADEARETLERGLMLTELVRAERLEASEEEIEDQIQTLMLSLGAQAPALQQFVNTPENRARIANQIVSEKAVERLILIAKGEAPELPEPDDESAESQEDSEGDAEEKPAE
jgi:trigger factor